MGGKSWVLGTREVEGDWCLVGGVGSSDDGSESDEIVEGPGAAVFCRAVAFAVGCLEEGRGGLKGGGLRLGIGSEEAGILHRLLRDSKEALILGSSLLSLRKSKKVVRS